VLEPKKGTAAKVRVLIEWDRSSAKLGHGGRLHNVIEASWRAMVDAIRLELMRLTEDDANVTRPSKTTAGASERDAVLFSQAHPGLRARAAGGKRRAASRGGLAAAAAPQPRRGGGHRSGDLLRGLPEGYPPEPETSVFRTSEYAGRAGLRRLFAELLARRYAVMGIICSGEPILAKWKGCWPRGFPPR